MRETVYSDSLYEFLYEYNYEAWFCNAARKPLSIRSLKDWFLKLHTGETLASATPNWPWDKREKLGQQYLRSLARDYLCWYDTIKNNSWQQQEYGGRATELLRLIEMDGFVFQNGDLVQVEMDVLDVDQEKGLLAQLYDAAGLNSRDQAFEFLTLSEEHYVQGRWADCISNSRKFLEITLREGAFALARAHQQELTVEGADRPVAVRQFLEQEGLVEKKERESLDKIYGLLSHTGSHPYMAEKDQARLLRQLSMTISQFVLLRLQGALAK